MDGIKEQILARKLQVLGKRPSPEKYEYLQTKRRKKAMQEYNNG